METLNIDWIDEFIDEDDNELDWYEDLSYEYDAESVEWVIAGARTLRAPKYSAGQQFMI